MAFVFCTGLSCMGGFLEGRGSLNKKIVYMFGCMEGDEGYEIL